PGNYTTTITVTGAGGGPANNSGSTVVADATLNPSAVTIHATEGSAFNGTVASFTDQNTGSAAGDFTASVDWGDGSQTPHATLVALGGGQFNITASHTWASAASRNVTVTLTDSG